MRLDFAMRRVEPMLAGRFPAWLARNETLVVPFLALCLGAFLSRSLLTDPGVVGLRHDWTTMLFHGQYGAWAASEFYGWNPVGLGAPSAYPNDWILLQFYRWADVVLDPIVISKLTVVLIPGCAAFGTYWLLRDACGTTRAAAALGAIAATLSPTMFNKIVAGQLAFLWALALLPTWLWAYRRARGRFVVPWSLVAACIAAVMSAQIQFIVFILLLIAGDALLWRGRGWRANALAAGLTLAAIAIVQCGTAIALTSNFAALETSLAAAPAIDWVRSNSPTIESAFELRGYVTHYYEYALSQGPELSGAWVLFARVFLVCIAFGVFNAYRSAAGRMAIGTYIVGSLLAAGLNGPGSSGVAWLYEHLRPMQLFREVYHWSAIADLGATMILGFAADALVRRPSSSVRNAAATLLVAEIVLFGAPSLDGEWSGFVQTVTVSQDLRATYDRLAGGRTDLRVLWWPIDQPMSEADGGYAGLDPMSWSSPPSMSEYILSRPSSAIVDGIRHHDLSGISSLLRYAGIGYIVYRSEFISRLPDFIYSTNDAIDRAYGQDDPSRAVIGQLGWRDEERSGVLDAYRAPDHASIVDTGRGIARISPLVGMLPNVPDALSPTFIGTEPVQMAILAATDMPAFIASYAEDGRRPLRSGIIFPSGNAAIAWARADSWWYYRDVYARVLDLNALSLRRGDALSLGKVATNERVEIGTIASPFGGALGVYVGSRRLAEIPTKSPFAELRSVMIRVPVGGSLSVRNDGGEAALRDVAVLSEEQWRAAEASAQAAMASVPALVLRLPAGPLAVDLPRSGIYRGDGIASIDGTAFVGPVRLRAGVHSVTCGHGGGVLAFGSPAAAAVPPHDVRVTDSGTIVEGTIGPDVSVLRLRSAFEQGWSLHFADGEASTHTGGDLFGNAWTFRPTHEPRAFRIQYDPSAGVAEAHRWSSAIFALMVIGALLSTVYLRRPRPEAFGLG